MSKSCCFLFLNSNYYKVIFLKLFIYFHRTVYEEEMLPDGSKRQINYEILKNKGLTPHRKKEQRNPRVKHRNKYEKAKKKIKSIKRIVVRQEGPYGGEITGIKTKLSRSIKFND